MSIILNDIQRIKTPESLDESDIDTTATELLGLWEFAVEFYELDKVICGNCLQLAKEISDNSINLIITSPPYYKQRDYGMGIGNENEFEEYIENL